MADILAPIADYFGPIFATMTSFVMSVAVVAVFRIFENWTLFGVRGCGYIIGMF